MRDIENAIIQKIEEINRIEAPYRVSTIRSRVCVTGRDKLKKLFEQLTPFGLSTVDFFNDARLNEYIQREGGYLNAWLLIEMYLLAVKYNALSATNHYYKMIESQLKEAVQDEYALLSHRDFANPNLIRNSYLSGDKQLMDLLMRFLPTPRFEIFKGYKAPAFIEERAQESTRTILKFLGNDRLKAYGIAVKIQRNFRGKKRKKEEIKRVSSLYKSFIELSGNSTDFLLEDADKPYFPQGYDDKLASRIFEAAKKVKLFTTIRHLTTIKALTSIMNDGLYGRKTLLKFNMSFEPAVLDDCDVRDGDSNTICFGPQEIDSSDIHDAVIVLDLGKIDPNECIFYKQRDFGFLCDKKREVLLGEYRLTFSHTSRLRCGKLEYTNLQLYGADGYQIEAYSALPKFQFIAYDFARIHQILTLNFFRFLDTLRDPQGCEYSSLTKDIYSHINKLNNFELESFLQELGKKMTDTAEFNFYGAHKINFSSVLLIKTHGYTLNLPAFVNALQAGDLHAFHEAMAGIPPLFKSYCFIDYLISGIQNRAMKVALQQQRQSCVLPFWLEAKENSDSQRPERMCTL